MKSQAKAKRSVLKRTLDSKGESYRFASNRGKLYVWSYREGRDKTVGIYGDAKGLRYLAKLLNDVADVNQSKVPESNCPSTVGVHYHLYSRSGNLHPMSESVVVGRADAKAGGIWFEPLL
jgi:hypothetical protein